MIRKYCLFVFLFIVFCSCEDKENNTTLPDPSPLDLDVPFYFPKYKIPSDNPQTKEGVELGRMLFYEKSLSKDNSISCASCHIQKLAFTDGTAFSKGVGGKLGKRSAMSLANLVFFDSSFFWDGRARSFEHQAIFPIIDSLEMAETLENVVIKLQSNTLYPPKFRAAFKTDKITSDLITKALSQFQRTLISSNSKYDQFQLKKYTMTASEANGMKLFLQHPYPERRLRGGNCGDCHGGFLQTFNRFQNNGLDANFTDLGLFDHTKNPNDKGKFRAPSLRNIAVTAPYMHDGRFKTLDEVLDHYNEHFKRTNNTDPLMLEATNNIGENTDKLGLTETEKKDIINFLHLLTDSTFLQNPTFSNPF
jgi:cytochrome c peroxidase